MRVPAELSDVRVISMFSLEFLETIARGVVRQRPVEYAAIVASRSYDRVFCRTPADRTALGTAICPYAGCALPGLGSARSPRVGSPVFG